MPISFTPAGISKYSTPVDAKTFLPISVNVDGSVTFFNLSFPANVVFPNFSTPSGITSVSNAGLPCTLNPVKSVTPADNFKYFSFGADEMEYLP